MTNEDKSGRLSGRREELMLLRCAVKKKANKLYIGECLELGLVSQGNSERDCKQNLTKTIEVFIKAAQEATTERIAIRPVPYYSIRRIIFDICYKLNNIKKNNQYFKKQVSVPIGI